MSDGASLDPTWLIRPHEAASGHDTLEMRSLRLSWASSRPHLCLVAALPGERGSDGDSSRLWSFRLPPHTGSERCWLSAPRFLPSCLCRGTKAQVLTKVRNTEMSTKKKTKILPRSIIQIVPQLFSLASSTYINKRVSTGVLCLKK